MGQFLQQLGGTYVGMVRRGVQTQYEILTSPGVWAALLVTLLASQCTERGPDDPRYPDTFTQEQVK